MGNIKLPDKAVVVYSMGFDGSDTVVAALKSTNGVYARQIYTLDRIAIAKFILKNQGYIPNHIYLSENIIKEEISEERPLYFVTMIHDPFIRHVRHAFHLLPSGMLKHILSNSRSAIKFFNSLSFEATTQWFSTEYVVGTGIHVYDESFDQKLGYKIFSVGVHKLLLLSAHLSSERKTAILSEFLGVNVSPITEETPDDESLVSYFAAKIMSFDAQTINAQFWEDSYAKHFFSSAQINEFKQKSKENALQLQNLEGTTELSVKESARDILLKSALSTASQLPYLMTTTQTMISKYGVNKSVATVESILKQLECAQNNLLLASMRTLFITDIYAASELGARWYKFRPDNRIVRTLAQCMQRSGAISKPLELFDSLEELEETQALSHQRLVSQKKLLSNPFSFSKLAKRAYTPNKKRVFYNVSRALPYHASGYATRTHGLAKGLRQCGWDIQVVSRKGYPADSGIILQEGNKEEIIENVPYMYDTNTNMGQHTTPLHDYIEGSAKYLVEQAKQMRPSLIHTASNYVCGIAGVEAARRLGLLSIYEMRGLWHVTRCSKEPAYENTEHFALAQKMEIETALGANYVLAITEELKNWLIDRGVPANKITVVPNAVDIDRFIICDRDEKYAHSLGCAGKIVVGYIGSFVQYEGLDLLIQAIAMLPSEVRGKIVLLWVGDGPVLTELLHLAEELGVSDNILSLGRKPFGEIPKLYSLVDISVFPRKGQPVCEIISPLKPFEAMAMGKAVIASSVTPLREIIDHGKTGLIHTKDDPVSLSKCLLQFIDNKDLRINCGKAARQWIEQTRSWSAISASVAKLYQEILK